MDGFGDNISLLVIGNDMNYVDCSRHDFLTKKWQSISICFVCSLNLSLLLKWIAALLSQKGSLELLHEPIVPPIGT